MSEKKITPYRMSQYTHFEILMESQLQSSGAHQNKILEKYKKNSKTIKNQALGLKIGYGAGLAVAPIIPLITFFVVLENLALYPIPKGTIFLVSSIINFVYFSMSSLYIIFGGLYMAGALMTGNVFKWLQTLPISKKVIKKLGFITLFRGLNGPLLIMTILYPIVMGIVVQSLFVFFFCLITSFINMFFSFNVLVIIGQKINNIFRPSSKISKKATVIKVITIVFTIVIFQFTSLMISLTFNLVSTIIKTYLFEAPPVVINIILSLIPFPFAFGYFVSISLYPELLVPELVLSSSIGLILSILIAFILYKRAISSLHSLTEPEGKVKMKKIEKGIYKKNKPIEVTSTSPFKAFIHKDLSLVSRDIQTLIFMISPIALPFIVMISMIGLFDLFAMLVDGALYMRAIILIFFIAIPFFLVNGLLNAEESGSSILASLPIVSRDQARSKLTLMTAFECISLIILSILFLSIVKSKEILINFFCTLPMAILFLFLVFETKILLFGRVGKKYVVEEIQKKFKLLKWALIVLIEVALYLLVLGLDIIIYETMGLAWTNIVVIFIAFGGIITLLFVFQRIFPRYKSINKIEI
ncbi:MAG: hypothetical protein JW891_13830 [Candidatus Lokiarchaeota archaeon]|nr:hypothetical protein [Candidatus Lokiarchaeota archaeon]